MKTHTSSNHPKALLCTLRGLVKPTARRNVRARGPVSAEVAHAGTDAGDCREGSEHGPLGRQGDRQRSARNGDGGGSFSVQLLALSILQSCDHQKLPRNRGRFELLDGTISGINCSPRLGIDLTKTRAEGQTRMEDSQAKRNPCCAQRKQTPAICSPRWWTSR